VPLLAFRTLHVPLHTGDQLTPLQQADHDVGHIELSWQEAVAGRGRPKVVVVMPSFSQGQYANEGVVLALILRAFEWLMAPQMANGVDAPGNVMIEKKPYTTHPDAGVPAEAEGYKESNKQP
jgi:hypothetical protein